MSLAGSQMGRCVPMANYILCFKATLISQTHQVINNLNMDGGISAQNKQTGLTC